MAAKYTTKLNSFIASSLIDNISQQQTPKWKESTVYQEGEKTYYQNNRYIAKNGGTSGTIPPTHASGTASDGSVSWIWVESMSINEIFKRNVYIFIGKNVAWADENNPDTVKIGDVDDQQTIKNILTLKKVSTSNLRIAVKRNDWISGNVYSQYDDKKNPLDTIGDTAYTSPFYVFTDENNIYKCLDNNNGAPSTIKPSSTDVSSFLTADGYVWKFIGNLDASSTNFLTQDYVPVRFLINDDGSSQYDVQTNAVKGSLSTFLLKEKQGFFPSTSVITLIGGNPTTPAQAYITKNGDNTVKQILIQSNQIGEGYDYSSKVYAVVQKTGTVGSGAQITNVNVVGGVIQNNITFNSGSGYSGGAICLLVDENGTPTTKAQVTVTVAGDGSISGINVTNGGTGYSDTVKGFIIPGDAGAVGLGVFAPKEGHGSNIVTELGANTVIIGVSLNENPQYLLTGDSNAFRQVGLITDVIEYGTTESAYNLMYIGPSHSQYSNATLNRIDANKGYILYLNNIKKVVRSTGQEELIKIAISV